MLIREFCTLPMHHEVMTSYWKNRTPATWKLLTMYDVKQPQSDWTNDELDGFNIEIQETTEEEFFGVDLSNIPFDKERDNTVMDIIGRMDQIMRTTIHEEKYMDNMATDLLLILGYETGDTNIRTREKLWLSMSRELVAIRTDICVLDINSSVLLIIQNGTLARETPSDPEAQLVAASIAAFQLNNHKRQQESLEEILAVDTVPGIVLNGAIPTFYKTRVSRGLDMIVQMGELPDQKSIVQKYCPEKSIYSETRISHDFTEQQRKNILLAYKAFKQFVLQTTVQGVNPANVGGP